MDKLNWVRAEKLLNGGWLVHLYTDNLIDKSLHMSDSLLEQGIRETCTQVLNGKGLLLTVLGVTYHGTAEEKYLFNADQWGT